MAVKKKDLHRIGWDAQHPAYAHAYRTASAAKQAGFRKAEILTRLSALRNDPASYLNDEIFGELAQAVQAAIPEMDARAAEVESLPGLFDKPIDYHVWGEDIDPAALEQMERACRLPISVAGAQMPDGHVGYGLPIGGVLATRNAVIPYGVGVDIACRMKMSIIDVPGDRLEGIKGKLRNALLEETRFGVGATFEKIRLRQHDVLDDPSWSDLPPMIRGLHEKAWKQLGTSGSGNHFVEWGILELEEPDLDLPAGKYIALLSHSGSRGFGATVAGHYTRVAMDKHKLPKEARHLAWLDLRGSAGQEYWTAMELAGRYAAANHDCIHKGVLKAAGFKPLLQIENHHNFAWIEEHKGERLVVHRKGATPAGAGVLGIIPGSMGDPGFIVRGKGNAKSLNSAAHGAGRRMSRKAAKTSLTRNQMLAYLKERGIDLLEGGLDEAPMAYKNIHEVMAAQSDLVDPIASFSPKIVLMAKDGKAED